MLLLNPDARLERADLAALVALLDHHPGVGISGPRILDRDGNLDPSQRRFPRRASTFAQALFLHRLWPLAAWSDELIRDLSAYGTTVWGATRAYRRAALQEIYLTLRPATGRVGSRLRSGCSGATVLLR